jgi:glycosyltransferase involved in cell wall biosynthesis
LRSGTRQDLIIYGDSSIAGLAIRRPPGPVTMPCQLKRTEMAEIAIIICTYNEAGTVAGVVEACCRFNPGAEVVVVDDGSTDDTEWVLSALKERCPFRYERLPANRGKSWAMVHGVHQTDAGIILFFDADVTRIRKEHFERMLTPLAGHAADMVLGQPGETLIDDRINPFKSLTGERALYRSDILPILDEIREIRFGVETFINLYYQSEGKRIQYVLLEGLTHPTTFEKTSRVKATMKYIEEGHEIALTYLENHALILRRIENRITRAGDKAREKISAIQMRINEKLLELKPKTKH